MLAVLREYVSVCSGRLWIRMVVKNLGALAMYCICTYVLADRQGRWVKFIWDWYVKKKVGLNLILQADWSDHTCKPFFLSNPILLRLSSAVIMYLLML